MEHASGPRSGGGGLPGGASVAARIDRALTQASDAAALLGGALIVAIMLMTVVSILGRYFLGTPVAGDFELTEIGCGIAAFLFFPHTQKSGHNIVAEFFTMGLSERARARLDAFHALIFAGLAAFLAWRLFEGTIDKIASSERTMLVGFPLWIGYVFAVASCVLLVPVCLWGARHLLGEARR